MVDHRLRGIAPADALGDWSLSKGRLVVQLAKALSPNRPVRVLVRGCASAIPRTSCPAVGWEWRAWCRCLSGRGRREGLGERRRGSAYQLRLVGADKLARVTPERLSAAERELLAGPAGDLLFWNDAEAAGLRVSLEPRKANYTATVEVEANAGDETLQENYVLHCMPLPEARVDRVVVRFSHRREVPLRWSFHGEDEKAMSARLWPVEEQMAFGRSPEEETWELTLRRPSDKPFEIRASRETKLTVRSRSAWPRCRRDPATRDAGAALRRIEIAADQEQPAEGGRIEPAPPGQCQTVRAAYQYNPPSDVCRRRNRPWNYGPRTWRAPAPWAWHGDLQSRFLPDGTAQHLASYRLQNCGESSIRLTLPGGLVGRTCAGCGSTAPRQPPVPAKAKATNPF